MRGRLAITIAFALGILLAHELTMALSGHGQVAAGSVVAEAHQHHGESARSTEAEGEVPKDLPAPCGIVRELAPTLQAPSPAPNQVAMLADGAPIDVKAGFQALCPGAPPLPAVVRRALLQVYRI